MRALTNICKEINAYELLMEQWKVNPKKVCQIAGCVGSQQVHFMNGIADEFDYTVIVTYDDRRAKEMCEDFRLYTKDVVLYPAKDFLFLNAEVHGYMTARGRIATIQRLVEDRHCVIVTTIDALMDELVPYSVVESHIQHLQVGDIIDLEAFTKILVSMNYERVSQVQSTGQFAVRGGIIDIFLLNQDNPVRIELWDDEINMLKGFDVESQRYFEEYDEVYIYPATEYILDKGTICEGTKKIRKEMEAVENKFRKEMKTEEAHRIKTFVKEFVEQLELGSHMVAVDSYLKYFYEKTETFMDYLAGKNVVYLLDEPARLEEKSNEVLEEFRQSMMHRLEKGYVLPKQTDIIRSYENILAHIADKPHAVFNMLEQNVRHMDIEDTFTVNTKSILAYNGQMDLLIKDLTSYKKKGYRVVILAGSKSKAEKFVKELEEYGIIAFTTEDEHRVLQEKEIMVCAGSSHQGFEYPMSKFAVISQTDIFGKERVRKKVVKKHSGSRVRDFNELCVGDYVIHENHGLGVYRGIEQIEVDRVSKDYIKIEYAGKSTLYILATNLDLLQKYANADASKVPKLNSLGSQEWTKTKTRVRAAVKDIAKELVAIYAARMKKKGFVFDPDNDWQKDFEESFPFEETQDQLAAIRDTKQDMESEKIMDRLVCGDVGFGKTEIAIRAAFKAVQSGKQVAVLAPTTILAQQHYNTFKERMKDYPIHVELLSRFRTQAQVKKAVEGLKNGTVEIVVGTHKLLSKTVQFHDLGLLIIDEEQRFGVTHKEKIKQLKNEVDVLTLTATPIPRTLHMSLVGIRDLSVLEEPPVDRLPIQTYVMEFNEETVREAVNRELARGGQVYYVYNRVKSIEDMTARIQNLVPDANVVYAHGQMSERKLEQIMYDFVQGEIDILVSTTIIETGLDIPNVNTIIIHDAENFGLSQLYQLRGRVGRSNRTSYAFMLYQRNKLLKETAEKRLAAIREFTELGSGIKIAMRDLEIRGAGDVLGAQQSGHMEAVGYDLYCKMLNMAVEEEKGHKVKEDFETKIDISVDAFIPSTYIKNEYQKLNVYKQIAAVENQDEYDDMMDELEDRFGEVPGKVINLLDIALMKAKAHKAWLTEVRSAGRQLTFVMYENAKIDAGKIQDLLEKYKHRMKLVRAATPQFVYTLEREGMPLDEYKQTIMEIIQEIMTLDNE